MEGSAIDRDSGRETPAAHAVIDLDEPGMRGWASILQAHFRIIRVLEMELASERAMKLGDYVALFYLSRSVDHALRMNDLADMVLLSRSGMTRVVDRLEREGFVVRQPFPGDHRGKLARLTPAGLERLREAFPVHHRGLQRHVISRLADDEWQTLRALMDRLG